MKIIKYLSLVLTTLLFINCEDVIDVDLNTAAPRLVIDASINWQKGTTGADQTIKLSTTTGFFSNVIPKALGATVSIKNKDNENFNFIEVPNTGEYKCATFRPVLGEKYTLTVTYQSQTYTASETLQAVTPIKSPTQKNNAGFSGKDFEIEVKFDDPQEKNFYLSRFFPDIYKTPNFSVLKDEFTNGKENKWTFSDSELVVGTVIAITHYGISESYYNYMNKIISISSSSGGGSPFQTPPATVRGNIVNQNNIDNYALGYFSLSEIDVRNYTIQ